MASDRIAVTVRLTIKEELVDEFIDLAQRTMIAPTQAVSGCARYELLQDIDHPERFEIIEEWDSEAAHAAHLSAEWLQPVMASLGPFAAGPFDMQRLRPTG